MIVGDGRPLRFLALVGGGWVAVRVVVLWHATGSLPEAVRGIMPLPDHTIAAATRVPAARRVEVVAARSGVAAPARVPVRFAAAPVRPIADPMRVQLALLAMTRFAGALPDDRPMATDGAPEEQFGAIPSPLRRTPRSRLSVSSWMIARDSAGIGATTLSPQLGGTQGGVRLDYTLSRGIAATARIAAPAAGAGRELSFGVAWRPAGVPLRLVAEQRIAIDGGRSGPALGISGGVSALPLPAGFRLEGYGQAGAIVRRGIERYVDGSVRAARPVTALAGMTLDLGGGAWGGAQRGVARVDIGPSIGARVPLGDRAVRVSLDWRQRVAGNARPGSGPALTLGSDF